MRLPITPDCLFLLTETSGRDCVSDIAFHKGKSTKKYAHFRTLPPAAGVSADGSSMTCDCMTEGNRRASPRYWTGPGERKLEFKSKSEPLFYMNIKAHGSSGSKLVVRRPLGCQDAGVYTCVLGTGSATVLVTPVGEFLCFDNASMYV